MTYSERYDLKSALRTLTALEHANPKEAESGAGSILSFACMASDRFDESTCLELETTYIGYAEAYERIVRAARVVAGRYYRVRGRCLVELGAKVEDHSACDGDPSDGLFIIGRRAALFIAPNLRPAVKAGAVCGVAIGNYPVTIKNINEMRWFRKNYVTNAGVDGMFFITGSCELRDLPKLVEKAEGLDYERAYERCSEEWEEEARTRGERAAARRFRACLERVAAEFLGSA